MAANTTPIFSKLGEQQWIDTVLAANTTRDLTSGTIYLVFTADGANGNYVDYLNIQPLGTNVATVMRVWLNNGLTTATLANNTLLRELTMAATTASEVAALAQTTLALGLALKPGYRIYVTVGTAVAAGFDVAAVGGVY